MMERLGNDFNDKGSVMDKRELEELRRKKGECVTCGRKCYERKLLRMIPLTVHGRVHEGRCLECHPLEDQGGMPAVARVATTEEIKRFQRGQTQKRSAVPSSGASVSTSSSTRSRERRPRNTGRRRPPTSRLQRAQSERGGTFPRSSRRHSMAGRSVDGGITREPSMDSGDEAMHDMAHMSMAHIPSTVLQQERHPDSEHNSSSPPVFVTTPPESAPHNPGHRQASIVSTTSAESGGTSGSSLIVDHTHHADMDDSTLHSSMAQDRTSVSESYDTLGSDPRRQPTGDELQEAINRITGNDIASVEAMSSIGTTGMAAHPTAAALLNYYHRTVQGSQRSLGSEQSNQSGSQQNVPVPSVATLNHGVLNRGGAVSFQNLGRPPTGQAGLSSSTHRSSFEGGRRTSSRYVTNSTRSLDSISSFGDDPSYRHGADQIIDESLTSTNYSSHHTMSASVDLTERAISSRRLSSGLSVSSHQSRNSNRSASPQDPGLDRLATVEEDDFVEVLNVMRDYPDTMTVQRTGLKIIADATFADDDYETLLNLGAIHVILEAMDAEPANPSLQIVASQALINACGTIENQCAFCEAGILDPVLRNMDTFRSNHEIQEKAMTILANLGAAEPNLSTLLEKGVIGKIIEAMENHSANRHVQMRGCSAITNFASHTSPLKKKIMDLGAGGAVVVTMSLNQNDSELQEKALRALRNLSANCDENKVELAHIGGVDSVVTSMHIHRDKPGVQEAGAWSLSNMAGYFANKRLIGECGGINATIRAMWVHTEVTSVQEWCVRALFTLTLDEQNAEQVLEVGGLSAVVTAMQAHVVSPAVQEMGCAVLCNLASSHDRRLRIVDEEALDAIVLAMVLFTNELMVQQQACQVLVQLAVPENFTAMQASNIPSLVQAAGENFAECHDAANWLLDTLNGFAAQYTEADGS